MSTVKKEKERKCFKCGDEIEETNWKTGYRGCFACREKNAQKEAAKKAKRVAPAYNKGAYQYLTSKQMVKDVGRS